MRSCDEYYSGKEFHINYSCLHVLHKTHDDDDVYLDKLQTRVAKKSILYMSNVDYSQQGISKEK
jgi:hypothetical protein